MSTTTKVIATRIRTASASEAVPEIEESVQRLAEAMKKYKGKRREPQEDDIEVSDEEDEQPTSPPAEEVRNKENVEAIQIWDDFMGVKLNHLPDTDFIKQVAVLVGERATNGISTRAGLQLLAARDKFVTDPEVCKKELKRKMVKLVTRALISEAESALISAEKVTESRIKKIEEVEIRASSMKKDVKANELTTTKKIAEANASLNEFLLILTDDLNSYDPETEEKGK